MRRDALVREVAGTVLLALLFLVGRSAAAQSPAGAQCAPPPTSLPSVAGGEFVHPDLVWRRWAAARTAGAIVALGDSVRAEFRSQSAAVRAEWRTAIEAAIDSLRLELRAAADSGWRTAPSASRFALDPIAGEFILFQGEAVEITITDAVPVAEQVAVCHTALLARRLADLAGEQARMRGVQHAVARVERWERFNTRGYSMTPLELLINSSCLVTDCGGSLEPPRFQLIAAHPSAAFGWQGAPWEKVAGSEGLAFEWGGILFYSASRHDYLGASFFTMYGSNGAPVNGVMLHVRRFGRLGLTQLRDAATGERRLGGVISADLFKLLQDRSWMTRSREAAVRAVSECVEARLAAASCPVPTPRSP